MPRDPWPHQVEALRRSVDKTVFALFMEQRTRKTKVIVDTCAMRYAAGDIDAALVVAWPKETKFRWEEDWPLDWPETLPSMFLAYRSGITKRDQLRELLAFEGFAVLCTNPEATVASPLLEEFMPHFLKKRRLLLAADEASSFIKTPGALTTKRLLAHAGYPDYERLKPNVVMRRVLDGTPVSEGSLDAWAPGAFLDWRWLGHKTFHTFKHRYAVLEKGYAAGGRNFEKHAVDAEGNRRYQNLEELRAKLTDPEYSFRVLVRDVSNSPEPEYGTFHFELTPKQRGVYDRLENEFEADLSRGPMPVALRITRLLRLQMVSRNYYPPETYGEFCPSCNGEGCARCDMMGMLITTSELERIDSATNPALDALVSGASLINGPIVIWTRFIQDAADVQEALCAAGRRIARYDGTVNAKGREHAYAGFRAGLFDAIVGTSSSGITRGHDLSKSGGEWIRAAIWYSNSYTRRDRDQSAFRTESLDRPFATEHIDLIGLDTRDAPIVASLRAKREVADYLLKDQR